MSGVEVNVTGLTKTFGQLVAVSDLTFTLRPGAVTGFLGPNGAGKSTTMRAMLGLVTPDCGTATFGGSRFADLARPSHVVGAVLDSVDAHPACTARDHLRVYAAMGGHPPTRVGEVIDLMGIKAFADRRTGGFSTGMRQRLSVAVALLGDPRVLLLDEPSNGLDPEGLAWLRGFLRTLASEGRTIMVSSHVLSEVQQTVDEVILIRAGHLVASGPLRELTRNGQSLEQAYLDLTTTSTVTSPALKNLIKAETRACSPPGSGWLPSSPPRCAAVLSPVWWPASVRRTSIHHCRHWTRRAGSVRFSGWRARPCLSRPCSAP